MRLLLGGLLFVVALCNPIGALAQPSPWQRGIHVFGSALFDFGHGRFSAGVHAAGLSDCSDPDTYCARSAKVSFVAPRTCQNMAVGLSWRHEGITTVVIDQFDAPQGHLTVPGNQWYALATEGFPEWIFLYSGPSGVTALLFDPGQRLGLTTLGQEGRLGEFVSNALAGGDPVARASYGPLITGDTFAACARPAG